MSLSYAAYHQLIRISTKQQYQIKEKLRKGATYRTTPIQSESPIRRTRRRRRGPSQRLHSADSRGLTEEFHPSQPVTPKQLLDWETKNKEPYPGYSEEFFNWENAWEEVNRAQQKADGGYLHLSDPVPVSPEFDETTGEPITYDEPHVVVDSESGNTSVYVDEADMSAQEIAESDPVNNK